MQRSVLYAVLVLTGVMGWNSGAQSQEQPPERGETILIQGLDGGSYEPYAPRVIERVQEALQSQTLYAGAVNGVLDQATMDSIAQFQEQHGLQVCGVPTPHTRRLLLQSGTVPAATQQQPNPAAP